MDIRQVFRCYYGAIAALLRRYYGAIEDAVKVPGRAHSARGHQAGVQVLLRRYCGAIEDAVKVPGRAHQADGLPRRERDVGCLRLRVSPAHTLVA